MKKNVKMVFWIGTLGLLVGVALLPRDSTANSDEPEPGVEQVFIETHENNGVYGDSIVVVYDTPMLIDSQPHPLAGGMEDLNGVPNAELAAPAEYPHHRGRATRRNAAKNYRVKITPGPYSRTPAFEGTWAELGGDAIYHPGDPTKRLVLLKPSQKNIPYFEPGDRVEVTVEPTVKGPRGKAMRKDKRRSREPAS
ncbi:MAG: hypothetical protein IV090_10605 [Candidatus Sericytochromatia bacterium]|nr:hypothetical protein [Candidatus Sericytochromatia bacterium]